MAEEKNQPTWDNPQPKPIVPSPTLKPPKKYKYNKRTVIFVVVVVVALAIATSVWPHGNNDEVIPVVPVVDTTKEDIAKLKVDLKAESDKTNSVQASVQNTIATLNDAANQINSLRNEVAKLQVKPEGQSTEQLDIVSLNDKVTAVMAEIASFKGLVDSYSISNADVVARMIVLNDKVVSLTSDLNSFKQTIGASTTIGVTPTTINGLTVTILAQDVTFPIITGSVPYSAQLTVKIANLTGKKITNLDVFGEVKLSNYTYGALTPGYPTLVDSTGNISYIYNYDGSGTMEFEVYQNASGKSLSLDNGASLTLRPKIGLMFPYSFTNEPVTIGISAISYDFN